MQTNLKATDIILGLSMLVLAIAVVIMVYYTKYDSAIALSTIMASIIIPFCTKNLELEKHQKQFLYEKKYNAYAKYFEICDDFWKISGQTIANLHLLNAKKYNSEDEFNIQKTNVIDLYREFSKIKGYLSMPGLEILMYINNDIETKIKEIVELDVDQNLLINSTDDLDNNKQKVEKYIKIISELVTLLKKDLGIEE